MMRRGKGVLLYSGGLDSLLAGRVLLQQDLDIIGLYCILPFFPPDVDTGSLQAIKLAEQIGIPIQFYRCAADYIQMLKNPPHGYGKQINPCIDCKIFFLKRAAEMMKRVGADFVATGEVVGQRPMSQQKHMLIHLEKEAGLRGRLLRPLSARLLKPTIPEQEGLVDREKLFGISGRGRKNQMALAREFGIEKYSSPAGGCIFTDGNYAKRVADYFETGAPLFPELLYLLTLGRYIRLRTTIRLLVSRNQHQGNELEKYITLSEYFFRPDFKGPVAFALGSLDKEDVDIVNSIIVYYGNPNIEKNTITVYKKGSITAIVQAPEPIKEEALSSIRI